MTFQSALDAVAPYERLALYSATGSRIVNFNNPAGGSPKSKTSQLSTIKKVVETLPSGSYSLAGKVSSRDEPVLFPFNVGESVEILSEPYNMDMNSELFRKLEGMQRELLDARLQAQEANLRAEMYERRNKELLDELEEISKEEVEPLSQSPTAGIFETIMQHAAPAIVNKVLGSDFLSDSGSSVSVPPEAVANAESGMAMLEAYQANGGDCDNMKGREQAQKLISRADLDQSDLAEFRSYLNRGVTYYDPSQTDCGTISYLLWGGDAMRDFVNSL